MTLLTRPDAHDAVTVTRTEVVRPTMCGHNSLLVGQFGDWTWDAVSAACGTDVLSARDGNGDPTYLSFYYFRIHGSRRFHLRTPGFGDRLRVVTRVFDFGAESVLVLHRVARSAADEPDGGDFPPRPIDPDDFYTFTDENHLYVESFNRWVTRRDRLSNKDLVRSSPVGFQHRHLPKLPRAYSPRPACRVARAELTFRTRTERYVTAGAGLRVDYPVDITRDLNGVGLLYFASYFSIVDWALLRLWRSLGRSDRSFLNRVVVDQRLCILGNADADCVISATMRRWRVVGSSHEVVDVVLSDRDDDRLLAVCTLRLLPVEPTAG